MKISLSKLLLMAVAVTTVACSSKVESDNPIVEERSEKVSIAIPTDSDSRTTIDPDGMTTRWTTGDKVAVWAQNSVGDYVLNGTQFMMHHLSDSFDCAYFDGNIDPMADGEYTYLLSYPMPTSVSGTMATYRIPTTQSGAYDGKYDIMLAEKPAVAGALGEEATMLNTLMRHKMHAIKITVPEGRNFYAYNVTRLEITFPYDVVGDVTFDVANPDSEPVYSNTSNTIVLENSKGFDFTQDIWVFVLPGLMQGDVSYMVRGEDRKSVTSTYAVDKENAAGHITPIRMAIPEVYKYTVFYFSVAENLLGEDFNTFTVTDHTGAQLAEFARNDENLYAMEFYGDIDLSGHQNVDLTLTFDSDHAIVPVKVNTGVTREYCEHTMPAVTIPYLFEEDFSRATAFGDGHDNPGTDLSGDSKDYGSLFSDYVTGWDGWSGARYGVQAGSSIRTCARYESGLWITKTYNGRIDTPAMARLKENANATLSVSFTYSGAVVTGVVFSKDGQTLMSVGWTSTTGAIMGETDLQNLGLSGFVIENMTGSFDAVANPMTVTLTGCNNTSRISFGADHNAGGAFGANANFHLYIDNIKVQIAN